MSYVGNDIIGSLCLGSENIGKAYLGDELVYDSGRLSLLASKSYIHKYPTLIVQGQYKWAYQAGLLLLAMLRTHDYYNEADDGILAYATGYYQGLIDSNGNPCKTPNNKIVITNYNLNEVMPACNLLRLIQDETNGSTWYNRYNTAIGKFATQLESQPRLTSGVNAHPYSCFTANNSAQGGLQMWLDILYMSLPFKAMYAHDRLTDTEQADTYDDVVGQLIEASALTLDNDTRLYRHAFAESSSTVGWKDPDTNGQSYFSWGRAIGWYLMAICEVLDVLPTSHSGRSQLLTILQNECSALLGYRVESVWRNLPTVDADVKDGVVRNKLESSGSSMFAYVFMHGARMGYLDMSYRAIGKSTYEAVVSHFITYPNGEVQLNDCMSQGNPGRGLSDKDAIRENYYSFGYVSDDPHGFGPFILASLEYEKMF